MNPRSEFQIEVAGLKVVMGRRTLIMGVLNVTPDSFSDGGLYFDLGRAISHGVELAHQGADWIDVGGESTRPGSRSLSAEEEVRRVLPVIRGLRSKLRNTPISIDTTKSVVAEHALEAGANILNDISGLRFDRRIADLAHIYRVPLILMYSRGTPQTMQRLPAVRNIWRSLTEGMETSVRRALASGVSRSQLILDPGLGFGKSRRQNYEILASLSRLRRFELPILIGTSRKSFVQAVVSGEGLEVTRRSGASARSWPIAQNQTDRSSLTSTMLKQNSTRLGTGDAAAVVAAILGGAHIVRVHEPATIMPALRIADALLAAHTQTPKAPK